MLTLCILSFQLKSTSTAIIGKTASNAEVQESVSYAVIKNDNTEEEWVEQKIDLKKLPRQYMQLSKIRLTGLYCAACCRILLCCVVLCSARN